MNKSTEEVTYSRSREAVSAFADAIKPTLQKKKKMTRSK